jgi:glutamate-1-semialdehyde 2,1-aminomutase
MENQSAQIEQKARPQSEQLFSKAKDLFPGGVSSPVRAFKSVYGAPLFVERGSGPYIWDADGHRYLDFCGSWGPLIHGHAHPYVIEAIQKAAQGGTSFGTPSRYENELGELILANHSYIEKLRFVSSGTEAVMSAIRLARGITGRDLILKFEGCYHGHVDALLVKAGSGLATLGTSTSAGIPEAFAQQTLVLDLDDLEAFDQLMDERGHELAAVIVEPVPANNGLLLQRKEFLEHLRKRCTETCALLIFDEVISGFRVQFDGAAGYYGIQPDLITFGKVIGGGLPVGAYAGSNAFMERVAPTGPVYQAGTLSGNPLAMASGKAQLELCLKDGFYEDQNARCSAFADQINAACKANGWPIAMQSIGSIFWLNLGSEFPRRADQIDAEKMGFYAHLHRELLLRDVYWAPSGYEVGFISSVHDRGLLNEAAEKLIEAIEVSLSYFEL